MISVYEFLDLCIDGGLKVQLFDNVEGEVVFEGDADDADEYGDYTVDTFDIPEKAGWITLNIS